VNLWVHSISWAPRASSNTLDRGPQVHLQGAMAWARRYTGNRDHQQQPKFPSETPACVGWLRQLWRNLVPSDGELQVTYRPSNGSRCIASAKCILVPGSLQECLRGCGV